MIITNKQTIMMKKQLLLLILVLLPMVASADAVQVNGIFYNLNLEDKTAEVTSNPDKYSGSISIPETISYDEKEYHVTSIGQDAFFGSSNLTSVTIPNSVTSIGSSAFSICTGLITLTIPNSVENIDFQAFYGCSGLISIVFSEGVTSIGNGALSNCTNLTSITIPGSVISIGEKAFERCNSLETVTIERGEKSIGSYCFQNCPKLTTLIIYGDINWGYRPFKDSPNIKNLTFGCKMVSSTFSGEYGFNAIENVSLLDGVEIINEKAFFESKNLKNVSFSNSLKTIGTAAFAGCSSLKTAVLNEGLLSLGKEAFASSGLESISIPSSVVEIGYLAFGCASLNSLIIEESDDALTIDGGILSSDNSKVSRIVLNRNLQSKTAVTRFMPFYNQKQLYSVSIGKKVKSIDPDYFEGCFKIGSLTFEDGEEELAIGESGRVYTPFSKCPIISLYLGRNIKEGYMPAPLQTSSSFSLTIGKGVTNFGTFFWNCTAGNIEVETDNIKYDSRDNCNAIIETASNTLILGSVNTTIPSSVVKIGDNAFKGCVGLNSITIPNSITSISQSAFVGCDNLIVTFLCSHVDSWFMNNTSIKGVVFDDGVLSIKSNAFSGCTGLTSVSIGNSVTSIGNTAFSNCRALSSVIIPQNVTTLGSKAFSGCSGLMNVTILCSYIGSAFSGNTSIKEVILGDGVISIYDGAFSDCSGLTSISIPNSVTNIGDFVFKNCTGLTNVTIPNSVTMIGGSAFSGCKNMTSIVIGTKVNTIGYQAFYNCSSLTNVNIPNCVENIYSSSFEGCSSLSSIIIEDGESPLMYNGGNHYRGCPLLDVYLGRNVNYTTDSPFVTNKESITSLRFGEQVTEIGDAMFVGFSKLITLALPIKLKKIGKEAFYGCEGLTSLTFPSSVTEIGQQAFDLCRGLTTLTFEDGEEELAFTADPNFINNAFANSPLEEIYMGRNISYPNVSPFFAIEPIKKLTLGSKVTLLRAREFAGCPNLKEVYSNAESIPATGENVFTESYLPDATLYVPYSLYDQYRVTYPWNKFGNMINDEGKYNLFYVVDGVEYKKYVVKEGDAITPEPAPTKEGYTFSGWSVIPETMPAHDVTISGTFSVNKYKLTYFVDGVEYKSYDAGYGDVITPEPAPTKEGYTFSGWSAIPETMPAHDVTVTGTFSKGQYKLTYMVDGQVYKTINYDYGDAITPEPAPEKEGYTFSGWSEIPATMPAHDVTVTGTFAINTYKLTYMVDDEVYKTFDVKYGDPITPEAAPTKEGYTFSGWSVIPETMPAHDVTVTGTFTIDTGIEQIMNEMNNGAVIYTLDGKRVSEPQKGVNIVRMNNGTTRKIVVK